MRRAIDPSTARLVIQTASEECCPHCGGTLWICEHRERFVFRLDGVVHQLCRDKSCPNKQCVGYGTRYRPLVDLRLALPRMSFGLDVVVAVGQGHLAQHRSLGELGRELTDKGVPVHQTHVGRLLRTFVALCKMARGAEQGLRQKLLQQGGIVLGVDGVQFDDRSPVLYLCWDARSGSPLFGVRMESRDTDALSGLMRRVERMQVPVLGVVTDGEPALVAAVRKVFPQVPHQLCQTHFLKNCAKPLEADLRQVGQSVIERAERVRKLHKRVSKNLESAPSQPLHAEAVEPQAPQCPSAAQEQACDQGSELGQCPAEAASSVPPVAEVLADSPAATAPSVPPLTASPRATESWVAPVAEELTEEELVKKLCALAKLDARASGKAPLNPPEMVRHQRLEDLRLLVEEAAKKKARRALPGCRSWRKRSNPTGTAVMRPVGSRAM